MNFSRSFPSRSRCEPAEAKEIVLELFGRDPDRKPLLIGPISMEIGGNYGLNETEKLLDQLVMEGVLRLATSSEMGSRQTKGYVLVVCGPSPV
jgi:hypothetical protein